MLALATISFRPADAYLKIGFICVLVAGLALVITIKFYVDSSSPAQNDGGISTGMVAEHNRHGLTERQSQQADDQPNGNSIVAIGYTKSLLLVIGGRVLCALINNIPLVLINGSVLNMFDLSVGAYNILLVFQIFAALLIIMFSEFFNFKKYYYVVAIMFGIYIGVLYLIGTLVGTFSHLYVVAVIGYILIAVGVNVLTYNQLSNAFKSSTRAWSIFVVKFVESLAYLAIFILFIEAFPYLILIVIVSIVIISALLYIFIPDANGILFRNVEYWRRWSANRNDIR